MTRKASRTMPLHRAIRGPGINGITKDVSTSARWQLNLLLPLPFICGSWGHLNAHKGTLGRFLPLAIVSPPSPPGGLTSGDGKLAKEGDHAPLIFAPSARKAPQ